MDNLLQHNLVAKISLRMPKYGRAQMAKKGNNVRIFIYPTQAQAVERVVGEIAGAVQAMPESVLGLATGGTMEAVYQGLIARHQSGGLSFARARSFNLDEYWGIGPDHPQSYHHYMNERFFSYVDFAPGACHLPRGNVEDADKASAEYEALIAREGPITLQLLGLGRNGHIGFNEPSSAFRSRTRLKTLARDTAMANSRYFGPGEKQPMQALTMGIGTILEAQRIVLLATGADKADAVAQMIEGPQTASCPASALQLHPKAMIVLDHDAAAALVGRAHYDWVQQSVEAGPSR